MTSRSKILAGLVLSGLLGSVQGARGADDNVIRSIDTAERDGALELAIQGSRPPSYSVFKLQDPQRLVIDLAGADVSALASPVPVGKAGVVSVATAQYKDQRNTVGRVVLTLDGTPRYEVTPRGDAVVIRFASGEAAAAAPAAPAVPAAQPAAVAAALASPAAAAREPAAEPQAGADPAPAADDHVVSRRVDEARRGARSARAVTAIREQTGAVFLATDGEVSRVEILELRDPGRLVLDLQGVTRAPRGVLPLQGAFSRARFGQSGGKVRVVLDAVDAVPTCQVKRVKGGLLVVPADAMARAAPSAPGPAAAAQPAERPAAVERPAAAEQPARRVRISGLRFSNGSDGPRIELDGKVPYTVSRADQRTLVLTLEGAELPRNLERSLDTTAFHGPVQMVSSFNQPTSGQVRVVVSLRADATDHLIETPRGLAWTFASAGGAATGEATVKVAAGGAEAAGFSAEAPGFAASGAPQAKGYTGRRITLDFHDIDIRNLLRLIADVSKRNIVVADDVTGKVTISLRNVPWDQALDLVLRAKGLGKEEMGNVIRIAKLDEIAKEQQARAEAEKARIPLIPLKVRIIPVNFARAADVASRVKDVLTERGSVSTDERTNVLIVKDIPESLVKAEGLVRNLDTEIPQVLIETRIVEASSNFNRALGVQWGGSAGFTQLTGNPTGLFFPNNATATGAGGGAASAGSPTTPNYAVNLPVATGAGSGGGVGFTFGSITGAFNLNLRLTALENSGIVKTISAPRISTIDNKEATIGQGVSIPFSQVSASGVNTLFIEAKLELKVTPHVSNDGSILLKIKASNNQPNAQLTGANGQPSISKREAETEVLVRDGDTTVIGGIYTRTMANRRSEVPWLGKIPVLGYFFRTTSQQDDNTELLIFITPRILNRSTATAAADK